MDLYSQAEYFNITFAACAVMWARQFRSCSSNKAGSSFQLDLLSPVIFQSFKLPSRKIIIPNVKHLLIKLQASNFYTKIQQAIYTELVSLFFTQDLGPYLAEACIKTTGTAHDKRFQSHS